MVMVRLGTVDIFAISWYLICQPVTAKYNKYYIVHRKMMDMVTECGSSSHISCCCSHQLYANADFYLLFVIFVSCEAAGAEGHWCIGVATMSHAIQFIMMFNTSRVWGRRRAWQSGHLCGVIIITTNTAWIDTWQNKDGAHFSSLGFRFCHWNESLQNQIG